MNTERLWFLLDRFKVHHILFWVAYYIFWVVVYRGTYSNPNDIFLVTFVYLLFNAGNFYAVQYWITPAFYQRKRYFVALVLFVAVQIVAAWGFSVLLIQVMHWLGIRYAFSFNMVFFYGIMSNITILGIGTALKQLMSKLRADKREVIAKGVRVEAELQYLKAQVNPHFLFNAINSVYFLIKKDPDKASETLIQLSDLLRFQLYDCSEETIPIEKELEYLQNYIILEKLRRGKRVTVEYVPEHTLRGFQLAPLLLIPFLENAFKFVSSHTDRDNMIRVHIGLEGKLFRASFFNTYEPLPRNDIGGIGLKNVKRRLELLYPDYTLDIRDDRETYTVTLTIPLP